MSYPRAVAEAGDKAPDHLIVLEPRLTALIAAAAMMDAPGGALRLADDLEFARIGYGAMRLPGQDVMGQHADRNAAKVGTLRGTDGSWNPSLDPESLTRQVSDNLEHLGLDRLDLVYLRLAAHGRPNRSSGSMRADSAATA